VQERLWHANSLVTMNLCAQTLTNAKRNAQNRLAGILLNGDATETCIAVIGTKRTYKKVIEARKL